MWAHLLGFGSIIPIISAGAAGMLEQKRPRVAMAFTLPLVLLSGLMVFLAVYLDQWR